MSWKKSYSPPPPAGHSYSEQVHSNRSSAWDSSAKLASARTDDHKRERERRATDGRRSRDSNRRVTDPVKPVTPLPASTTSRPEDTRSPVLDEPHLVTVPKVDEVEEPRPSSSAVDAEENFSDFSDDVDEILNRDLQVMLFIFTLCMPVI